jgi:hypothetical protein
MPLTELVPFIVAVIFFFGYTQEQQKERIMEKYVWLLISLALIVFGFWNLNYQCGSTFDSTTGITTYTYCPDTITAAFGTGLAPVFIFVIAIFIWRVYEVWKVRKG